MRNERDLYDVVQQRFHSLLMLCLLLWLTVSTPFVYQAQQDIAVAQGIVDLNEDNPLSGTNEEKVESGVNTLSEYLHDLAHHQHHFILLTPTYKLRPDGLYLAFHPEQVIPPPKHLV